MKHEFPTANVSMAGPSKSLVIHFNRLASDLLRFNKVVCLFMPGEIVLREAGMFDNVVHTVNISKIKNSLYKRVGINSAKDKEIFCGLYRIEYQGDELILSKTA